jgi:hypothetical protein
MAAMAPDPTNHTITDSLEGDVIRLTCTAKDCGWNTTATEDRFVPSIKERHARMTGTYKGA